MRWHFLHFEMGKTFSGRLSFAFFERLFGENGRYFGGGAHPDHALQRRIQAVCHKMSNGLSANGSPKALLVEDGTNEIHSQ